MTSQVTDVLEAVQSFIANGYDREYRVKDGNLVDLELGSTLDACSIRVDAALRLESGDDGEDASNIYAITDPATEHKGLLIDAFDVFHEICPRDLSERLVEHRETAPAGDQDAPSKHGLRKVLQERVSQRSRALRSARGLSRLPAMPFLGDPSASSASIPPSRNMSGSSRASFEILG
ncbi:hypothetical protein U2P60_07170 [Brucella sp. H1_1004]|uniref:hypothetical protein n=1 Tax=Brucella sp. H1_1004 TaxID=3110109 RepID=UPI0039B6418E